MSAAHNFVHFSCSYFFPCLYHYFQLMLDYFGGIDAMVHKYKDTNGIIWGIVSNKRPGGVAIFQKGDVYKRQVFNAKMQCLSLFTMTRRREI